ncbi:MAG: hypothetical protein LBQ52_02060 [Helicobacteraceae bacterium]|jgi:hypothetical protein|nr:hypothetical protein [Helicobacteraceae bacterium]
MAGVGKKLAADVLSDDSGDITKHEKLYERLYDLSDSPYEIFEFALEYLNIAVKTYTIFEDALSYITKERFEKLIAVALKIWRARVENNEPRPKYSDFAAQAVIERAAFQFPELLHEHLREIYELDDGHFYQFWRAFAYLPKEKIAPFKEALLSGETTLDEKKELARYLIGSRDIETIRFVYDYALKNGIESAGFLEWKMGEVGFAKKKAGVKRYCYDELYHITFPKNYSPEAPRVFLQQAHHPTWSLPATYESLKFGGVLEDGENPFCHIITFDKIPEGLNITGLKRLVLGSHLRECDCDTHFYQHDQEGNPRRIGDELEKEYLNYNYPIQPTELSLSLTPERWRFQDWAVSNSRENLFRIGGEPSWIQGPNILICPICGEKMDFLMQLDTGLPDLDPRINDGEVYFGSGGMYYAFWCDECKVSGYVMQCT